MTTSSSHTVTLLLRRWSQGDRSALELLSPMVYQELHQLAEGYLRRERPGHTLQPTALVHEAYIRLVDQEQQFEGRHHFYGVAAHLMRMILVDHARGTLCQLPPLVQRSLLSKSVKRYFQKVFENRPPVSTKSRW